MLICEMDNVRLIMFCYEKKYLIENDSVVNRMVKISGRLKLFSR